MSTTSQTATRLVALPRVNLLPPEIAERKQAQRIQAGLALVVVIAVGAVGLLYNQGSSSVSDAQTRLTTAQSQQTSLQAEKAKLSYVTTAKSDEDVANAALTQAMGSDIQWSNYLADLSVILPAHAWFTSISMTESVAAGSLPSVASAPATVGSISFAGDGISHNDLAAWLDAASKEKGFANPYFSQSQQTFIGKTSVAQFAATVDVSADALSSRCAQPGSC